MQWFKLSDKIYCKLNICRMERGNFKKIEYFSLPFAYLY